MNEGSIDTMDDDYWAPRQLDSGNSTSGGNRRDSANDHDDYTNAIRLARDRWTIRSVHVNDSSEIIDAIDVEMLDISSGDFVLDTYIVLDTNVLLSHLSIIKQTVAFIEAETPQRPIFLLIPGIVVSELDFQKQSRRDIAYDARKVSEWLAKQIGNAKGHVKGQAYTQTMLPSGDWRQRNGLSNDELILDCCKYFNNVKRKDVVFCTGDNNLIVQACANATDLFLRGESAVICPSRKSWSAEYLLKSVAPEHALSPSGPTRVREDRPQDPPPAVKSGRKSGRKPRKETVSTAATVPLLADPYDESHSSMDIDMEEPTIGPSHTISKTIGHYRDEVHQQLIEELRLHVRHLTGKVGALQMERRRNESRFSPLNKFSGILPSEDDWMKDWSVRECLQFIAKIVPPQPQPTRRFGESEASSLADFLAKHGEKGARRGREWAKKDWMRQITSVVRLAETFEYAELGKVNLAVYEHQLMDIFAIHYDQHMYDNDVIM